MIHDLPLNLLQKAIVISIPMRASDAIAASDAQRMFSKTETGQITQNQAKFKEFSEAVKGLYEDYVKFTDSQNDTVTAYELQLRYDALGQSANKLDPEVRELVRKKDNTVWHSTLSCGANASGYSVTILLRHSDMMHHFLRFAEEVNGIASELSVPHALANNIETTSRDTKQ